MEQTETAVLHGVDTEHGGGRIISIVHRVKETTKGESRPTMMAVMDPQTDKMDIYKLAKEEDEIALAYGHLVVNWRKIEIGEDVTNYPGYAIRVWGKETRVAAEYEGIRRGDTVITTLGGSGLYLNYGLAYLAERVGAHAIAISSNRLAELRNGASKDDDVITIARLYVAHPEMFYRLHRGNRVYMDVTFAQRQFDKAQNTRMAAEQRLYQQVIGEIFMSDREIFPFDNLKQAKEEARAQSDVIQILDKDEERAKKELDRTLEQHPGSKYFLSITGIGPSIGGRVLGPIGDPIRFIVLPDINCIMDLRRLAKNLEQEGGFTEEAAYIAPVAEKKLSHNELLIQAAIRLRGRGEKARAQCLSDATRVYGEISKLYDRAAELSARKMVAYCGLHVLPDGSFPRRRRAKKPDNNGSHDVEPADDHDESALDLDMEFEESTESTLDEKQNNGVSAPIMRTNNWPNKPRQALYNWGDQLIKRASSYWGIQFRIFKERFTLRHAGDDAWPNGRIHRKALWRARTRMLHGACKKWCRDVVREEVRRKVAELEGRTIE